MKFLPIAAIVVASLTFASPAFAVMWEGRYEKPQQVEGGWKVTDPGKGQVIFATCENNHQGPAGKGWYCHTLIQRGWDGFGGSAPTVTAKVQVTSTSGSGATTEYAVFNPLTDQNYLPAGMGNVVNLTDNSEGAAVMRTIRSLCKQAGGDCIFVTVAEHDYTAAIVEAKRLTGWRIGN
jgi:hypothetical protein